MKLITILLFLFSGSLYSQSKEGYWDNVRTTNEAVLVTTSGKKIIKTANFPEGTTEVVFRITVLDDNQQLSGSLVSLLKAIPDPTGISQGSAGALFLASKIVGDDKCKFSVFSSSADAENFVKTGKPAKAVYSQETAVNKDAKLLNAQAGNFWFVLESDNWIMNEKIVIEVVPWVDHKLSRGWNMETKKEILTLLEKQKVTASLKKKDEYYAVFLDEISKRYTFREYKLLLPIEKSNALETITEASLKKSGEIEKYYNTIREKSHDLFKAGKTSEAIDFINSEMIAKNRAGYKDYGILGDFYLLSKQFTKAEDAYQKGLKLNPSEIHFQLNLAHVYLFSDRESAAREIYKKFKNQSLSNGLSWVEQARTDFKEFERRGFPKQNYKRILRIME